MGFLSHFFGLILSFFGVINIFGELLTISRLLFMVLFHLLHLFVSLVSGKSGE